jgi:hypothetical protein
MANGVFTVQCEEMRAKNIDDTKIEHGFVCNAWEKDNAGKKDSDALKSDNILSIEEKAT